MSYSEKLIDHYENPRNIGSLDKDSEQVGTGLVGAPACGDVMKLQIKVSAEGEDAVKLAQLLKLAGLGSGSAEAVYQPVEVEIDGEEEIEEEKDDRYHASTTPDVEVFGTDVQLKGGNGDVAGQEKKMRKHGYQFGDNPLAMKETVARDYESIKVRK